MRIAQTQGNPISLGFLFSNSRVAQGLEQDAYTIKVGGSNPSTTTIYAVSLDGKSANLISWR